MSEQAKTLEVKILDKEYLVACPPDQQRALIDAASHLDSKMREIRTSGKVFGTERIAVMAALNITHDLLQQDTMSDAAAALLKSMDDKLGAALGEAD
ncbi:cell division protein ZapA [Marinobacter mobilis]|uniref:Cell division protein ZapA n=1 Tax=Marinobacter mobilis TaxID=488533 RepID=A0A1H3AQH0_9GAMM|nr:cell division protein ZapA [Marinobacter mobilis]SDX31109.1 cell division protein ZapA [Marinobacter mobilis]